MKLKLSILLTTLVKQIKQIKIKKNKKIKIKKNKKK
jgi:hypothetical protein